LAAVESSVNLSAVAFPLGALIALVDIELLVLPQVVEKSSLCKHLLVDGY